MNISKTISDEPITKFIRVVHYAGLQDYPAIFQPQNIPVIEIKFICEYFTNTDHLVKRILFTFKVDNNTKVNPSNGAIDENGVGQKDFFDALISNPGIILSDIVYNHIGILDGYGDFNEENWGKREVKPYPFV